MPPKRGRTSRKKYYRGYSRNQGGLGLLGVLFFLVLGLIIFGNEKEKKVGWGIIAGICVLCFFAQLEDAAPIVFLLIIVVGILVLVALGANSSNNNVRPVESEVIETPVYESKSENKTLTKVTNAGRVSSTQNPYRYEEKFHNNNKPPLTVKTSVKPVMEPIDAYAESIVTKDSGITSGMALGEMEWTHIEKGERIEEDVPEQEFFATIKDAIKEYQIPDDYIRIMIETNSDGSIKQCPALVWKDNFFLNILPMIQKSSVSCWSLKKFKEVSYKILENVDPDQRYNCIGMAELATEFEDRFPEYMFDGKHGTYTTTFVFPEGFEVTNTSAKEMFKLLEPEFVVEDEIMISDSYEPEIKEVYKKYILWLNGVIDAKEYHDVKEMHIAKLENSNIKEQLGLLQIQGITL